MQIDAHLPLRTSDFARLLGVKRDWLKSEAEAGRVPALRAGDDFLFHPGEAARVLLERAASGDRPRPLALGDDPKPMARAS